MIFITVKITGTTNPSVVYCLHSKWREMLNVSGKFIKIQ